MAVQAYAKVIDFATSVDRRLFDDRQEICRSLGLERQANVIDLDASELYPPLSKEETWVWLRFLPTSYSFTAGEWKDYSFDIIPTIALKEISKAFESKLFINFEIRTPEKLLIDPMVIGLQGRRMFPIVRWGESLKPFNEIKNIVCDKYITIYSHAGQISEKARNILCELIFQNSCGVSLYRRLFLYRHCGQKMATFSLNTDDDTPRAICPECGEIRVINNW